VCGRFTLHLADLAALAASLGVKHMRVPNWQPRFNIAPTQLAPVVRRSDEPHGERSMELLAFGIVPAWSAVGGHRANSTARRLINARVETVSSLRSFRTAFKSRRCVVPATGFFEWQVVGPRGAKQPFWIHPRDGGVMHLAGLWEPAVSPDGEVVDTFAIVTTAAAEGLRAIHDRMPLELAFADVQRWLGPSELGPVSLEELVLKANAAHLDARPVGRSVSSPHNDDPRCIAATDAADGIPEPQLDLFEREDGER